MLASLQLHVPSSPIPAIHITDASPIEIKPEPRSPFSPSYPFASDNDDSFRAMHLSPPPLHHQRSPLNPSSYSPASGKGLDRERFESLLKATRNGTSGKRGHDLRREVAIKAHKSKQGAFIFFFSTSDQVPKSLVFFFTLWFWLRKKSAERRALFLSKIEQPPSPSAISTPVTPPESPAVFHYSLPSPGLVSPLALFESLENPAYPRDGCREGWVEQVDFRLPKKKPTEKLVFAAPPRRSSIIPVNPAESAPASRPTSNVPSLDQITARLSSQGNCHVSPPRVRSGLPAFLQAKRQRTPPAEEHQVATAPKAVHGRAQYEESDTPPLRALPTRTTSLPIAEPRPCLSPVSPVSPLLQITTTVIPRTSSSSPVKLTEANLSLLNSRQRMTEEMLSTLRRRTFVIGRPGSARGANPGNVMGADERKGRRISAPAELPSRARNDFVYQTRPLVGEV